ncbi:MAG: zinc-finger domain-containing protein [Alphaproteobacteria bacterium]|nr:zinc-finger domain-containing protein [Alphaproteobacteria bacterium]MCW5752603.1 zinc-finger domain-containing protein [Alphaproteobacteria bacterium]
MSEAELAETVLVDEPKVACDGGDGPLGHPRVYLNMGERDRIDCPYCGRVFKLKPGARRTSHGH